MDTQMWYFKGAATQEFAFTRFQNCHKAIPFLGGVKQEMKIKLW
jgi:hypothetical protein